MTLHRILEKCKEVDCPEVHKLHDAVNFAMKEYAEWKNKEIAVDKVVQDMKIFVADLSKCPHRQEEIIKVLEGMIKRLENKKE